MEITRQADYYGLPTPEREPPPPPERVAEQLAPAVPWSGPSKIATQQPGVGVESSGGGGGDGGNSTHLFGIPYQQVITEQGGSMNNPNDVGEALQSIKNIHDAAPWGMTPNTLKGPRDSFNEATNNIALGGASAPIPTPEKPESDPSGGTGYDVFTPTNPISAYMPQPGGAPSAPKPAGGNTPSAPTSPKPATDTALLAGGQS
jgi:hypothetical protein